MPVGNSLAERLHFPPLPGKSAPLWLGVLGAPAAWGIQMQANYALAHWSCVHGSALVRILSLVFLALAVMGGLVCLRYWKRRERDDDKDDRTRFLASYGLMTSGLFSLLIIAQTIDVFLTNPCTS